MKKQEAKKCDMCGGPLKIDKKIREKMSKNGLYNKEFWDYNCDECFKENYCEANGEDHCGWEMPNGDTKCLDCGIEM